MKQYYCFLERFNNYFNRKIIKYESLSDYESHSKDSFIPISDNGTMTPFDFNPNDNVMTEIIANGVPFDPDYFLLMDENTNIIQRWFIMEQKRNRQGQWVYTLKRDVIADNLTNLNLAPIFVQKGMLSDDDPMIFNSEGMVFNQIKKEETLLKDLGDTSWIICYLAKSLSASDISFNVADGKNIPEDYVTLSRIAKDLGISEADLASALNFTPSDTNKLIATEEIEISYVYKAILAIYEKYFAKFKPDFLTNISNSHSPSGIVSTYLFDGTSGSLAPQTFDAFILNVSKYAQSLAGDNPSILGRNYCIDKDLMEQIKTRYNGKIVLYLGNFYTLSITSGTTATNSHTILATDYTSWNNVCVDSLQGTNTLNTTSGEIGLKYSDIDYRLEMISYSIASTTYKVKISASRKVCEGQEFDIVAIPNYASLLISGDTLYQPEYLAQKIASKLAIDQGTNIYDIQLLPYCPRPEMIAGFNIFDLINFTEDVDYSYIKKTVGGVDVACGAVFYLNSASFQTVINKKLGILDSKKIDSQCNFYRLVSPNYQGSFEFNVAKNGGSVDFFTVYCTYKPYTPFIKVCPQLKDLYGKDYNDNRGLICGGDFSLPRASSAWEQYQLENKNYQNIFNREIQNLNFMQSIEMRNQIVSGAIGIASDSVKGASAGAMVGGPWGAVAGGILGGATSAVGFGIDVDTMAKVHRENRQLAVDKFNYQLGNIKALPYTLTKVGAFDVSSKIYPFLEYYSCTDIEKDALRNKIKYESMTVMRIGTLNEFKNFGGEANYFKGELIRNDEIADDPHVLNAIYEEFLKGVYI